MQQRRVCPLFPTFVFGEHIETNGGRSEDEIASAISEAQCNFSGRSIGVSPYFARCRPASSP